jgi:hypothetical protein
MMMLNTSMMITNCPESSTCSHNTSKQNRASQKKNPIKCPAKRKARLVWEKHKIETFDAQRQKPKPPSPQHSRYKREHVTCVFRKSVNLRKIFNLLTGFSLFCWAVAREDLFRP